MRASALIVIFVLTGNLSFSQSPYSLNWKTDGIWMVSSSALVGAALILENHVVSLTTYELSNLDANDINWFDRSATEHFSAEADYRSDFGEVIPIVLGATSPFVWPLVSGIEESYGKEMFTLLMIWGETNLISLGCTHLLKNLTTRTRPFVYNPESGLNSKLSESARKSFISGHTTASATNTFFLAKVFTDYFPESKLKPYIWGLAVAIPAWTGVERYLAGKHFPTDIIAGYAVGALCGYFIPRMHQTTNSSRRMDLAFYPYSNFSQNGLQMVLKF